MGSKEEQQQQCYLFPIQQYNAICCALKYSFYNYQLFIAQSQSMTNQYWVGIRRQDKSVWQRRTPLTPHHLKEIIEKHQQIKFIVQPSQKRIFSQSQYEKAGAKIDQDLSQCSLILGIKEVPMNKLIPDKTYMYFSHTIKAQLHNMPSLDAILNKNIRLIDYEKISDQNNNRLIAFGKFAGMAGTIDFLKGLGQYIMQMGMSTPLLYCYCSYKYFDIKQCYAHLKEIGDQIKSKQLPSQLSPMIFAITGRGRTSQGCMQVLQNFPITKIEPCEVERIWADKSNPIHRKTIYLVNINTEDCIIPLNPDDKFDKNDYYKNPHKYQCIFNEKFLPYISALFHCIFWQPSFPKYILNKDLSALANTQNLRLLGICDITCDLQGSIQCLQQYTQPQRPFFYYDSIQSKTSFEPSYKQGKIMYLAIDFLPCQLAFDASCHFSHLLKNWIDNIVKSDKHKDIEEQGLQPELKRAVIACNNKLTPNFQYIFKLKEQNLKKSLTSQKKHITSLEFDKTNSMMQNNVIVISNIQGEALDFSQ